jgi:putative transcriptional regulator
MEKGKYNPSLRLAWKIARIFNKPIEEVFSFDDEV